MRVRAKLEPLYPRKRLAWWWVCSLWLCAFVHVSSLVHFAVETHEVCQQHGELTHASHGSADGDPVVTGGDSADHGSEHVDPEQAPEAHSHCCPPADRATINELPERSIDVRQLEEDAPRSMVLVSSSALERARYRLAPKTSPPA